MKQEQSPDSPLAFYAKAPFPVVKSEMKPGWASQKRVDDQKINVVPDPTKDIAKIKAGTVPAPVIERLLIEDPEKLEELVQKGLPLKNYKGIMDRLIERGDSAKNFEKSITVLSKAGITPDWTHVRKTVSHLKDNKKIIAVLDQVKGLRTDSGIKNLAYILKDSDPNLCREIIGSRVVGSSGTRLSIEIGSLKGLQPASKKHGAPALERMPAGNKELPRSSPTQDPGFGR